MIREVRIHPEHQVGQSVGTYGLRRPHLLAVLVAWLAIDSALLLAFLGKPWGATLTNALLGLIVAASVLRLARHDAARIPLLRAIICLAIASALLMLGGEGGFFYANTDWQVRDALLRDMARFPWPFAYAHGDGIALLRAPIGMYLLPALGGAKRAGLLLLLQNTLLIGTLLALGSTLFDSRRSRAIAAFVIIAFGGMNALGALLIRPDLMSTWDQHLESWAGIRYSSTITLLFWVPQHSFAGWLGALLFLLWRRGAIPLAVMLAPLPLYALWSPLALAGTVPFAALAGMETLLARRLRPTDILLPLIATIAAIPALAYMTSGSGAVGVSLHMPDISAYGCVECFDVIPFLYCLYIMRRTLPERIDLALVGALLLVMPMVWIGWSDDFMMRASIPALTLLAVWSAEALVAQGQPNKGAVRILVLVLLVGALTPVHEFVRAVRFRPSPPPLCPVTRTFWPDYDLGFAEYMAPVDKLRGPLRPKTPFIVTDTGSSQCWDRPWAMPR